MFLSMLDGNIMVKELPPLKSLQSPLLSPLLNGAWNVSLK